MKDILHERLIFLAAAQERMTEVSDQLEYWDSSLSVMEKNAFELINASDRIVNMTVEGKQAAELLIDCYGKHHSQAVNSAENDRIISLLCEIHNMLSNIEKASLENNDISHTIESDAACQKEQMELIKKSLNSVGESINSAAACEDLMLIER